LYTSILINVSKLRAEHAAATQDHQRQLEYLKNTNESVTERTRKRTDAEIADLRNSINKLESELTKVDNFTYTSHGLANVKQANKNHLQDLQTANEEYTATKRDQDARLERAEEKAKALAQQIDAAHARAEKAEKTVKEKDAEKQAVQTELDDLLMVFGDLEEKVNRYRERLRAAGENVTDAEDDDDDDEEEDEEEDDEDVDVVQDGKA